jgi:hypothetical protein
MKLPVWIPFIIDECLGYINSEPHTSPYIIWGDPLSRRSHTSTGYVTYNCPWMGATQREGYPFYPQQTYRYVGIRNRELTMQEGVIIPPWRTLTILPTNPTLHVQILQIFKRDKEHNVITVWANVTQTWDLKRTQQQAIPGHQEQIFTDEHREMLQDLDMILRVVCHFLWRSQRKKQVAVLRA